MSVGEIKTKISLQNKDDLVLCKAGHLKSNNIREVKIDALVDTGAVEILLPQEVVEQLGLDIIDTAIVTLANNQEIELKRAGDFILTICGRKMTSDCLVGPPLCEPLIGQIVMEKLDLVPNPRKKTLTVNPASPFLPHLKLK